MRHWLAPLSHTQPTSPLISVVRRIENFPTSSGDVPTESITITDCGELEPTDPSLSESAVPADGDPYEDYPEDDDAHDTQNPAVALEAARVLRELGATRWKAGAAEDAYAKWQKALRYLDVHAVMRAGAPAEFADEFAALRVPLMLNSALAALKAPGGTAGALTALEVTKSALRLPNLSDSDRGTCCSSLALRTCNVAYIMVDCSKGAVSTGPRSGCAQGR